MTNNSDGKIISIWIDKKLLKDIDEARGRIKRSSWICDKLEEDRNERNKSD